MNPYTLHQINHLFYKVFMSPHFLASPMAPIPFVYHLHKNGILYHFDDDAGDIRWEDGWVPTKEQVILLNEVIVPRMKELASRPEFFQKTGYEDLFDIGLTYLNPQLQGFGREFVVKWGFSFDEEPDNHYKAYTRPDRWNGWGVPLLTSDQLVSLCKDCGYTLKFGDSDEAEVINPDDPDGPTFIPANVFNTSDGKQTLYDTGYLGLCFNIEDCQESDPEFWSGFI